MKSTSTAFLYLYMLASMLLPISFASAQITADEFNAGTLNTAVWRFNDPREATCVLSSQSMTATQARISVPGGSCNSDPYPINQAPRLVQQVAPFGSDVGQFAIWAKFDTVLSRTFQIEGVEAIQDDKNFVRCEIYYAGVRTVGVGDSLVALLFSFDNAGALVINQQSALPTTITGSTSLSVRLDRIGTTFSQYYSTDGGTNWTQVNSGTHTMNVDSVAVYGATSDSLRRPTGGNPPALSCLIDYFRTGAPLPIQLASFSAALQNNSSVRLNWTTATETNNFGFEVQKSLGIAQNFQTITNSFIPGHGTTLEPRQYSYVDFTTPGSWFYRLKQIDLDGTIHYTEPIQITVVTGVEEKSTPTSFAVRQNYPNPFNPSTLIKYELPTEGRVTLEVFTILGQKVATLVDEIKPAGFHAQQFNAEGLTSGVYLYKLSAAGFSSTRSMLLIK